MTSEEFAGLASAIDEEATSAPIDDVIATLIAAKKAKNTHEALNDIKTAIAGLDKEDLDVILNTDEFQNLIVGMTRKADPSVRPGSLVFDASGRPMGKVPYTPEDVNKMFPIVEWTPTKTTMISYNGVNLDVHAMETIRTAACFRDIFFDSERETARAYGSQERVLREGPADGVAIGTGWMKMSDAELEQRYGREV